MLWVIDGKMADRKNIKLILEYDGTHYRGWQRQKNGPTIQGILEEKIQIITKETSSLISSGRTDAGVHALHQVCNFRTNSGIEPESLRKGLNSLLPDDIYIRHAEYVPPEFHSRYDALRKTYEYRILNRTRPDLFLRAYSWHIRPKLDISAMEKSISSLLGQHDFSSFRSTGSGNTNPVRKLLRAEIQSLNHDRMRIIFEANGFLRHMVRNIVGTLVEVGKGKMSTEEFTEVLYARDRQKAGIKAPPQGLFLVMVRY